jgi:hypothetical protein
VGRVLVEAEDGQEVGRVLAQGFVIDDDQRSVGGRCDASACGEQYFAGGRSGAVEELPAQSRGQGLRTRMRVRLLQSVRIQHCHLRYEPGATAGRVQAS